MSKSIAKLALLLFIVIAVSSAYQTISTITTVVKTNEGCSKAPKQLKDCQGYLVSSILTDDGRWRKLFPKCCDQLEVLDEQCRCEAINMAVQEVREYIGGELHGQHLKETQETAASLLDMCRISPRDYCKIQGGTSFV